MSDDTDALERHLAPHYQLGDLVGRGGMASVYRARDLRLQRDVAIKVLSAELASSVNLERFKREISIAAALQHPHIVPVFDAGRAGDNVYYVMPLIVGETLRERLKREPQMPLDDVISVTKDVAAALTYAHGHGIVHRDIKPENILFSGGTAVVADFGIARALTNAGATTLTDSSVVIGTAAYMSPEQAAGGEIVDSRTDIYALGCVVYEMIAGEPPFSGRTVRAILARQLTEPPPSIRTVRPTVSLAVQRAVEQALAKQPVDRFASATDFVDALARARTLPDAEASAAPRDAYTKRRFVGIGIAVAMVAAFAVAGALWFAGRGPAPDPNRVVVFPFAELGQNTTRGSGEQIALLIGSALEHTEPLRWLDGLALAGRTVDDASRLAHADASKVARAAAAQYYLAGTVLTDRDSIVVIMRLHDAVGDSLVSQESAGGIAHNVTAPQLALRALTRMLARLLPPNGSVNLSYLSDRPPAAVADWLLGEREFAHAAYVAALGHMDRALARDSAMGVAALKGAQAAAHLEDYAKARAMVDLALRLDRQLPLRHRRLALGLRQYFTGAADSALISLESAQVADSSWSEPWMWIGETYHHLIPARTNLNARAEAAFGNAVRLNAGFAPALFHLTELAVLRGDLPRAQALLQRFRSASPDSDWVFQADLTVRCAANGPSQIDWRKAVERAHLSVASAAAVLASGARYPACARAALDAVLAHDTAASELHFRNRWAAVEGRDYLAVSQGDIAGARHLIDSVRNSGMLPAVSLDIFNATAGVKESELQADSAMASLGRTPITQMGIGRLTYLSLWTSHRGDIAGLDSVERRTRIIADSSGVAADRVVHDAAAGRLALLRGDSTSALVMLRQLRPAAELGAIEWDPFAGLAAERLLLAQLQVALGDSRGAIETAVLFDSPRSLIPLRYLPASLRVRVGAAAKLGDRSLSAGYSGRLDRLARP